MLTTDARPVLPARSVWRRIWPWSVDVNRSSLRRDAIAGLLGAVLVLPQGIAFASLAGLPPQMGLAAAVLPCIVAALAGSSRHVVSGPTNANSLALGAMLAPLALAGTALHVELALALTLLVGAMQWLVGALRLGAIANFISPTALLGFTSGAALLIAWYALPSVLGWPANHAAALLPVAWPAIGVTVLTLAVAVAVRRWWARGPHLLLALAAGTLAAWSVPDLARIGTVAAPWPTLHWPAVGLERWRDLLGLAAALTVVALAQSIAIARVVAERSGQRLDGNREFIGQGLANLVGGCSGALVSCGSLNRSLPNLQAGAQTPLAAVFAGVVLVPLVALAAPLLAQVPMAAIGALLLLVSANLLDLPRWRYVLQTSKADALVAAITLVATLTLRLELAVLIGSALSLGLYLQRTAHPAMRTMGFDRPPPAAGTGDRPFVVVGDPGGDAGRGSPECPQVKLLRMEGSVYFAATAHVSDHLQSLRDVTSAPRHLLVMAKSMNFIDLAGADLWRHELRARRASGGDLYFHRPRPPVLELWGRDGFLAELGADHVFPDKRSALRTICLRLDRSICAACDKRVFEECHDPAVVAPRLNTPSPATSSPRSPGPVPAGPRAAP